MLQTRFRQGVGGGRRWTFSRRVDVFQLGAAVKPSILNERKLEKLFHLLKTLDNLGYSYLVLDSEKSVDDLSISDYDMILRWCRELFHCMPILTIPVRRGDFADRFKEFLEVVSQHGVGGVCLVAGNPAYLNEDGLRVKPGKPILEASADFRAVAGELPLMVGSENLVKTAAKASKLYRATPLVLMNPNLYQELKLYQGDGVQKGVYAPFHIAETMDGEVKEKLQAYVSRRRVSMGFWDAVEAFSMTGGLHKIRQKVSRMSESGVDVLVGYPLDLCREQLSRFAKVL
ncbi:MAG: hypothetical protein QXR26_00685 [Candidatus Caldarchaeum sp.]